MRAFQTVKQLRSLRLPLIAALVLVASCSAPGAGPTPTATPVVATSPTAAASPGATRSLRPGVSLVPGTGTLVRSSAARATPDPEAALRASRAIEAFAADLYRELAKEEKNVVASPYSIVVALAMARLGAAGKTAAEMDTVLKTSTAGDLHTAMNALEQTLAKRPGKYPYGSTTVDLELATANQLWAQGGYRFYSDFIDGLASNYGAGMQLVDYASAHEQARQDINKWVAERTRDRIPELLARGTLNELTRFVLTNALYMKAKWQWPFSKAATRPAPFHRLDGSASESRQMLSGGYRRYTAAPGYQVVQLDYVGGLSMSLIVPDAGTFRAFEASLDGARLRSVLDGLGRTTAYEYVTLRMPRFEFRTASPLREPLSRLGMPSAFDEQQADLSRMTPEERVLLQGVAHEAFISVDEEGTEAAAATAVFSGVTGGPSRVIELTIDRPFLFLIRDNETGAILFVGRLLDPAR